MRTIKSFIATGIILASIVSSEGQTLFEEIAPSIGIQHTHVSNKYLGGGVAIFDFDNDGWQDIYLTGGEIPDKLLHNLAGQGFEDVSAQSGISQVTDVVTFGVVTGDVDNDGYRDILVTTEFGEKSILMRNQGDGTFVHLPNAINDGYDWKSAASFGDVNKDGLLDIYISAYVFQSQFELDSAENVIAFEHDCSSNKLFINNGDLTFIDVTIQYGVGDEGCALAVAFSDFDNDADVDLFLTNDFGAWVQPSALFENKFPVPELENVSSQTGLDLHIYGMGIAIGDYDKDSDLDYYQTNLGRNVLMRNDGGVFLDVTTAADCENDSTGQLLNTGWGTFFFDADNDSWTDLFVSNGWIRAAPIIANVQNDPNVLYLNNGDGTFTDVSNSANVASLRHGRGAAFGDFDNDGKLDFVVNNVHSHQDSTQFELFHNISEDNNWVAFQLHGVQSNRDAFGAHVRIYRNGVSTISEVGGGSSHGSQNSSIVHFGLGTETLVDSVIVSFPSGINRVLINVPGNQVVDVFEDIATGTNPNLSKELVELYYYNGMPVLRIVSSLNATIQIFDVSGKMLIQKSVKLNQGEISLYNFIDLSAGVYFLMIQGANRSQILKATVF